ncbi:MAG: M23 family metallopeptidase [Gammaproteobacteria bacterium]|nr:M23 family metallopeptidase [Gammaproteobacteria bacterium]
MNIIVFTRRSGKPANFQLDGWRLAATLAAVLVLIPVAAVLTGVYLGKSRAHSALIPQEWAQELVQYRAEISRASDQARDEVNALATRLGHLQAQAVRINALGQRLVEVAKLDKAEFNFAAPPAQGGPQAEVELLQEIDTPNFMQSLDQLAAEMDSREQQLRVLESFFMNRSLDAQILPTGRPIQGGWISSYFGMRTDPFTGRREYHKGIDFAGKEGTEIQAVAAGLVTWSADRHGYGQMVEINHGNGYITRYAHNRANVVKVGDVVTKGQRIALMGSSGRSTGPHVHFEVLKNGRVVDPAKFVYAAK